VAGVVETAREEAEEDKRSWCVFRGDLVREIARMALRKHRGLRADNSSVFLTVRWVSRLKRT